MLVAVLLIEFAPNLCASQNSLIIADVKSYKIQSTTKRRGGKSEFRANFLTSSRDADIPTARKRWNSGNVPISQTDGLQIRWIISDSDKWLRADGGRWEKRVPQ